MILQQFSLHLELFSKSVIGVAIFYNFDNNLQEINVL
jgi:hypothetical protein